MFPCSVYFPKDPELKKLYDYLAQYFEPKIRLPQAGSKSAESLEDCQEQDAGAAGVESGESQESELEEAGPVCLHDVYAAISPQESDPSAVMARKEEKLCWTLGGTSEKHPAPVKTSRVLGARVQVIQLHRNRLSYRRLSMGLCRKSL